MGPHLLQCCTNVARSAIPDTQVPPSMRRLQVAFLTFASRQPRMSAITSSGCVLVARSSRLHLLDCNDCFHDTTVARVLELIVASLAFAVVNFRCLDVFTPSDRLRDETRLCTAGFRANLGIRRSSDWRGRSGHLAILPQRPYKNYVRLVPRLL